MSTSQPRSDEAAIKKIQKLANLAGSKEPNEAAAALRQMQKQESEFFAALPKLAYDEYVSKLQEFEQNPKNPKKRPRFDELTYPEEAAWIAATEALLYVLGRQRRYPPL